MKLLVAILILLNFSCSASEHVTPKIEMQFHFGVDAKNRLDTVNGSFVRDMVLDPPITVSLQLSADELRHIASEAERLGFFELPTAIHGQDICELMPCSTYYLRIRFETKDHNVSWNDCHCEELESLIQLRTLIINYIRSKKEYKDLPKPRGGYCIYEPSNKNIQPPEHPVTPLA